MWRGLFTSLNSSKKFKSIALSALALGMIFELSTSLASANSRKSKTQHSYQDRIERFVSTEWAVGTALGFPISSLAQFENRIRKMGAWAAEHNLPMPSGFSLYADADAGFVFGTRLGAEVVFLIPESGNLEVGVFAATDAQVGAEATLGVGAGASLIFNMDKIEELGGPIVGANSDIHMIEGVGASLIIDVEREDIKKFKEALASFALESPDVAARKINSLVDQKRLVSIGAQYDWGVGAEVSVAVGWRTQLYATELPVDPDMIRARMISLKQNVQKALLKLKSAKKDFKLVTTPVGPVSVLK